MKKDIKRIGVITSGGDCSGLNAAIRAITFAAVAKGWDVYGPHSTRCTRFLEIIFLGLKTD